jgi:MFS family permease
VDTQNLDKEGPGTGPLGESWRAWIALAVGVLAVSAHSMLHYGISPLMKTITEELSWSRSSYAQAVNFRLLLMMAIVPFAGALADRWGPRAVLTTGAFLVGLGVVSLARMDTLPVFFASSVLIGPGQAFIGSVAGSVLVLRLFRKRQGLAIGILNGGDNLITGMVHSLSALLLLQYGWRGALGSLSVGYFILGVLIWTVLASDEGRSEAGEESPTGEAERPAVTRIPWGDKRLWLVILTYIGIYSFVTSIGFHFPAFRQDMGSRADEAAWLYSFSTIIGGFGSILIGWISERLTARTTLLGVVLALMLSSIILWLPVGEGALYGWAFFYGIANAGGVALLALTLSELFGDAAIGKIMGFAMVFCMGATVVGNWFTAAVFDNFGGYIAAWQAYTVVLACAAIPAFLLRRVSPAA